MNETLVLLEDDRLLRDLYSLWLRNAGYVVFAQPSSQGILDLIDTHQPALIITDLVMPDFDGTEGIFKIIERHSIPIIAISSFPNYLSLVAEVVGATLDKPLTDSRLVGEVARLLNSPK